MQRSMQHRVAGPSDVDAIAALIRRGFRGEASRRGWTSEADLVDGLRTDAGQVHAAIAADGEFLLGAHADHLFACCHCEFDQDRANLGMLTVDPDSRGRGLGSEMLAVCEPRLRDRQVPSVRVIVLDRLVALGGFYQRRGYERTGRTIRYAIVNERYGRPKVEGLVFEERIKRLVASPRLALEPSAPDRSVTAGAAGRP